MWFVVAVALLVLAPVVFLGALFTVLRPLTQEDAVFSAGDGPVQVDLPADEERTLFSEGLDPVRCTATDGSGEPVEFRSVTGDFTYNEWQAVWRFDTGDGDVTFDCGDSATDERLRIAQLPSTGGFVTGIAVGIIVPLLLGGAGLIMLIVVSILWATGAPREMRA